MVGWVLTDKLGSSAVLYPSVGVSLSGESSAEYRRVLACYRLVRRFGGAVRWGLNGIRRERLLLIARPVASGWRQRVSPAGDGSLQDPEADASSYYEMAAFPDNRRS